MYRLEISKIDSYLNSIEIIYFKDNNFEVFYHKGVINLG
jgi:hypothetical protein